MNSKEPNSARLSWRCPTSPSQDRPRMSIKRRILGEPTERSIRSLSELPDLPSLCLVRWHSDLQVRAHGGLDGVNQRPATGTAKMTCGLCLMGGSPSDWQSATVEVPAQAWELFHRALVPGARARCKVGKARLLMWCVLQPIWRSLYPSISS